MSLQSYPAGGQSSSTLKYHVSWLPLRSLKSCSNQEPQIMYHHVSCFRNHFSSKTCIFFLEFVFLKLYWFFMTVYMSQIAKLYIWLSVCVQTYVHCYTCMCDGHIYVCIHTVLSDLLDHGNLWCYDWLLKNPEDTLNLRLECAKGKAVLWDGSLKPWGLC